LHPFRDIAFDRSKIAVFGYPSCIYPVTEWFPWDDLRNILSSCQLMAKVQNGVETLRKISIAYPWRKAIYTTIRMWSLHRLDQLLRGAGTKQWRRTTAGQYSIYRKYWARAVNDRHTPWQPVNAAACCRRGAAVTSRCSAYRRDAVPEPSLTTTAAHTTRPSTDTPACLATPRSPSNAHAVAW